MALFIHDIFRPASTKGFGERGVGPLEAASISAKGREERDVNAASSWTSGQYPRPDWGIAAIDCFFRGKVGIPASKRPFAKPMFVLVARRSCRL
jgi:hypothetical protein